MAGLRFAMLSGSERQNLMRREVSRPPTITRGRRRSPPSAVGTTTVATAATVALFTPLQSWLITVAACIVAGAVVAGILLALPAMLSMRRSARELHEILLSVKQEIPRTASVMRLSGLEFADAVEEMAGLTGDLTSGLRSTANMVTMTEQSIKGAPKAVREVVSDITPVAKRLLETQLKLNAALEHQTQVAQVTKTTARRARGLLRAGWAAQFVQGVVAAAATSSGTGPEGVTGYPYEKNVEDSENVDPGVVGAIKAVKKAVEGTIASNIPESKQGSGPEPPAGAGSA